MANPEKKARAELFVRKELGIQATDAKFAGAVLERYKALGGLVLTAGEKASKASKKTDETEDTDSDDGIEEDEDEETTSRRATRGKK